MQFDVLEIAGMSAPRLKKLTGLINEICESAKADIEPGDKATAHEHEARMAAAACDIIANIGLAQAFDETPRGYMDKFALPLLEKVSGYMGEARCRPLMLEMLCHALGVQRNVFFAMSDENGIDTKRKMNICKRAFCGADELFEMMKQNDALHHEAYFCYMNMGGYNDAERWAVLGEDIKKTNDKIRGWKRSGNWVVSILARRQESEMKPFELLFDYREREHVQALMPAFRGLSNSPDHMSALAKVATLSTDCDVRYLTRRIRSAQKARAKALRGREKKKGRLRGLMDDFELGNAVLALRNKRYLKLCDTAPLAYASRIHLTEAIAACRGLSNELFIDDFMSPELDENGPKYRVSLQPSIKKAVDNRIHPVKIINALGDSGLHMSKKVMNKIYGFLSKYMLENYIQKDPEIITRLAARARRAYHSNRQAMFYKYDVGMGELCTESFPRGKELLREADELARKVLREKLVSKPGKKYHDYKGIEPNNPEQLSGFMFELSEGCANSIRDNVLKYANLLINQPSFAMVYRTKADPNSIFIKSAEREWRDLFGGWAADSCTDPLGMVEFIANKNMDYKQIWWAGTQYGLVYSVDDLDSSDKKSMCVDSIEVHPAFFSKFRDRFGLGNKEIDDKLLGTAMKVIEQEADGDTLYIRPTSNQPRITRWMKEYAKEHGLPLYRTSINDNHTDVKYRQLKGLYRMMIG